MAKIRSFYFSDYLKLWLLGLTSFLVSPPFNGFVILFFFFGFLLEILEKNTYNSIKRRIFLLLFAIYGFYIGIFHWLGAPLLSSKIFYFLIPFAVFLPSILMIIYFLPFCFLYLYFQKRINSASLNKDFKIITNCILFSLCWSFFEFFRSKYIFNGFPWYNIASSLSFSDTLLNLFYFFDVNILNFLTVFFCFVPYLLWKVENYKIKIILSVIFGSVLIYFLLICEKRIKIIEKKDSNFLKSIAIIPEYTNRKDYFNQNINLNSKKISIINTNLLNLLKEKNNIEYIIFPENSLPFHKFNNESFDFLISEIFKNIDKRKIKNIGFFFGTEILQNNRFFNVIYFIKNKKLLNVYYKKKLVPFGEYNPMPKFLNFISFLNIGGFNEIDGNFKNIEIIYEEDFIFKPKICYESTFFDNSLSKIKNEKKIIINVVNDTWFSGTIGPYQHFLLSRIDAIINDSYLARSTNNGISALISPSGFIINKT